MTTRTTRSLLDVLDYIVDNRGRSCPVSDTGMPLIATNCLKDGRREPVFENIRYVNDETYSNWFRAHPEPGDVLFVCKGSPGRVAVVPDPVPFCIAQDMLALRANPTIMNAGYLYYRLCARDVRKSIENMHVGTMIPHFKKGDFGNLRFSVHDNVSEQRAIAEVLGALDDKIAANGHLVLLADQLAAAIMVANLDGQSEPLASYASITMGSSPPGVSYNEVGNGVPFYQGVRDFGTRFPQKRVWTSAPVRMANASDTLISVRAPVGRTNLANESLCIGRGIASLRSVVGRPMTLFHQLRAANDVWAPYEAEGTIFGAINKKQLEAVSLPCVRDECEHQLEGELVGIEGRIAAALAESNALTEIRDELLPLLMSGKLRVRDAERVVEEAV